MNAANIVARAHELKGLYKTQDRKRIRAVMNGGVDAVNAVLQWGAEELEELGGDLPAPNIMFSGLERLAQKLGRAPTLKTDMIPIADTNVARQRSEKKARIVHGWDDVSAMEMQYPQVGRWLPGYGFTFHVIREQNFGGSVYPVAELRDPFNVYLGQWGPNQQPVEAAAFWYLSMAQMKRMFAGHVEAMQTARYEKMAKTGTPILGEDGWGGNDSEMIEVVEYFSPQGTILVAGGDTPMILSHVPNPLSSGPAFVAIKRFSFDQLISQYHHSFGTMLVLAKLNILGLAATEDSVFKETNVYGKIRSGKYKRGRFSTNLLDSNARVEKPTGDQITQVWQAINILERQFRIETNYDVAQDGQSPNSFATGQGIRELGQAGNANVREYQVAMRHGIELVDQKRLEWEEAMHPTQSKRVYWFQGGNQFEETYTASKDIAGDFRTRRVYGAMATFDEQQKIASTLQLLGARMMDRRTGMENLDGFENIDLILERIDEDQAKEMLMQALGARAAQEDAGAMMALVKILEDGKASVPELKRLFTPEEPQMSPEQAAMMMGGGPPGLPPGAGPPPGPGGGGPPQSVQSILSRIENEAGGVQTVVQGA